MKKIINLIIVFIFIFNEAGYARPSQNSLRLPMICNRQHVLKEQFDTSIGREIDRQTGFVGKDEIKKLRWKLQIFINQFKTAKVECIGSMPDAKKLYKINTRNRMSVIFCENGFLAVSEDARNGWVRPEDLLEGFHYYIIPELLFREFSGCFSDLLRQKQIIDDSVQYESWIFFSLINPYLDRKVLREWFLSTPLLRHLLSKIKIERINFHMVNWIYLYPAIARIHNNKAEAYVLEREICIGLEAMNRIAQDGKGGYAKGVIAHEIGHQVMKDIPYEEKVRIFGRSMQALVRELEKSNRYQDLNEDNRLDEAIVRMIEAVSIGSRYIQPGKYDQEFPIMPVTEDMVEALVEIGLLESTENKTVLPMVLSYMPIAVSL